MSIVRYIVLGVLVLTSVGRAADSLNDQLLSAARRGDLPAIKRLLDKGADVNAKTLHGVSALCFAAGNGHLETVRLLLERGADLNQKDPVYGMDALGWAAYRDQIAVVKMLLPRMPAGRSVAILNVGVSKLNLDLVRVALAAGGVSPAALSFALGEAIRLGADDVAGVLRKAGAVPPPRGDFAVEQQILQQYVGLYRNEKMDLDLRLTLTAGVLSGLFSSQEAFTLGAINRTTFRPLEREGVTLTFDVKDGKTAGCTWKNARRGTTILFTKVSDN